MKKNCLNFKKIFASLFMPFFCMLFIFFIGLNINLNNSENYSVRALNGGSVYTQAYLDYLSSSPEEKMEYQVIPRMYEVEPSSLYTAPSYLPNLQADSLPSGYMLYNDYTKLSTILNSMTATDRANCDNLPLNVGNQHRTGICWSFASLTAFETSLYKTTVVSKDANLNFSELDLAYVTQVQNYGDATIGGGSFELACEYIMSEMGPVYEKSGETAYPASNWVNDGKATEYYRDNFYGSSTKANYTALETYYFPSKHTLTDSQSQLDLRASIKNHIMTYGGVTSSIYMDSGRVTNTGTYMYMANGSALTQNHLVTIVGWNDDITHISGGVTYRGAYIVQNSYGSTEFGINGLFYVMYDDLYVEDSVAGFVRVATTLDNAITYNNMKNTTSENQYLIHNMNGYGFTILNYSAEIYFANIFERQDVENQYISKILIPTVAAHEPEDELSFYVYVLDGLTANNVAIEESIQSCLNSNFNPRLDNIASAKKIKNKYAQSNGDQYLFKARQNIFYGIELNEQVDITSDYFAIILQVVSGPVYFKDNVDDHLLSKQITWCFKGINWEYNSLSDGTKFNLPMIVQTQYQLGEIEYSSSGVNQVYSSTSNSISVNVINLPAGSYTIYYSLTPEITNSWATTKPTFINAGEYTVYFKIVSNYCVTIFDSETVIIKPKKITILPYSGQGKTYGNQDGIINYNYLDNYETPKFSGKLSREVGEDVGLYVITIGNLTLINNTSGNAGFLASNYYLELSPVIVKYEIRQRPLYVVSEYASKIYGDPDPEVFTYTYSNEIETPNFSGYLSRSEGENVNKYEIKLNNLALIDNAESGFKAGNYNLVYTESENLYNFEIVKREIIITPKQNQQKVYLADDGNFEFSCSNVLTGQIPLFTGALTRESGEDVGTYKILLGSLDIAKDNGEFLKNNYKLKLDPTPVYFTINYGELEGCEVEDITTRYTSSSYSLDPVNSQFNDVKISYSLDNENWQSNKPVFKNVGEYLIYVKFEKVNYASVTKQATIKINPINLTVVPNQNQLKVYGDSEPKLTYSYSGNIDSEKPFFVGNMERTQGEDVGVYLIEKGSLDIKDSENFVANNYNLVFDNSLLTKFEIVKRDLIVKPTVNQVKTYGKEEPTLLFAFENTLSEETPDYIGTLSRQEGEEVGTYEINLGSVELQTKDDFKHTNYNLILSETKVYFEIEKANITLTIQNESSYYGDPVITNFNCQLSSDYVEGDNLNINYYCEVNAGTRKGNYTISATAENNNYNIEIIAGNYEVKYYVYEVNFMLLGEKLSSTQVEHFSLVKPQDIPQVELLGYEFNYWKVISADTSYKKVDLTKYQIIKPIDFVADMQLVEYTITLQTNNQNNDVLTKNYTIADETFDLEIPQNKGHTFMGWYSNESFEGEQVTQIQSNSTGNKIFYAKWQINVYNISFEYEDSKFALTYKDSLQKEYNSSFVFSIEFFEKYSQSIQTVKSYYQNSLNTSVLNEIDVKASEDNIVTFEVKNIEDNIKIVFDGVTVNTYTIDFVIDDEVVKTISKEYGESLTETDYPQIPSKQNYDDTTPVWEIESVNDIKENYSISAIYTPNIYEVTFIVNNGTKFKTSVVYGDKVDVASLKEACDLNMFEYFIFDSSLEGISQNTTINVKIESNIYILYIVLGCLGFVIMFTTIALIIKHKRRNKFKWWNYTSQR